MKKHLALILAFLLLITPLVFSLSSCGMLPDAVIFQNDVYIIERKNGKCRLNFKEGNEKDQISTDGCVQYPPYIEFASLEAMTEALTSGTLDDYQLFIIRNFFERNEDDSIVILDPEKFLVPTLPLHNTIKTVQLCGDYCNFVLQAPQNSETDTKPTFYYFNQLSQESYDDNLSDFEEDVKGLNSPAYVDLVRTTTEDRNATVYEYSTEMGRFRQILYTVTRRNTTIYVREFYRIQASPNHPDAIVSETVPREVRLFGCDDGICFSVYDYNLTERPSMEWIGTFGIEEY